MMHANNSKPTKKSLCRLLKQYNSHAAEIHTSELEVTYHLHNAIDTYKKLFYKLSQLSKDIQIKEYVNIHYDNDVRITKQFYNGVNLNKDIVMIKKQLSKPIKVKVPNNDILKYYNIKLNAEKLVDSSRDLRIRLRTIKHVSLKLRLVFILDDSYKFKVEMDLIKNIDIMNGDNIKDIKDNISKNIQYSTIAMLNHRLIVPSTYSLFDDLILETEFIKNEINDNDILKSIEFIKNILS